MTTRVGMIGAGSVAARHATCLASFDDVAVVAVADTTMQAAEALAAPFAARAYGGHQAMLANERLDAVYICVPPFAHGAPELAVLEARLPFFVEKPVALDCATAELIAERVEEAGVVTATGYWWRYLDVVEQAAALIGGEAVRLAVGMWIDKLPPPAWWILRSGSGGQIVEQATHVVDILRLLVGEIEEVWATGAASRLPGADIEDVTAATLKFTGGAVGSLAATCALPWKHAVGVQLFTATAAVALTETSLTAMTGEDDHTVEAAVDAKTLADRAFIDAVQGKTGGIRSDYRDAVMSHRVGCALAESVKTGKPIRVDVGV